MTEQLVNEAEPQTVQLSDRELWLIRASLQAYLTTFGHDEGEFVEEIKALVRRLRPAGVTPPVASEFRDLW